MAVAAAQGRNDFSITTGRGERMNMQYVRGQFVGYVPIEEPISVPSAPKRWYILCVTPGRDGRVVDALKRRGACAYSPTVVRYIDRRTRLETRKPHVGKRVEKPFLPGLAFVPDFDVDNPALQRVDDIGDFLKIGEHFATLSAADMTVVRGIVAAFNVPLGVRDYAIGQLIRIVEGPMADFVGQVQRLDSKGRLKVFVEAFSRGASVTVTEAQVEPVAASTLAPTATRQKRKLKRSERRL
jgi:transcription antitermination factor NusG